ncbi:GntR family transcriptional regulator [Caulobacter sp. CCH5-E12]|uniref:GntR family transcriptional regulator n=1 Tax=Caulobacter sp. CCH5-E12 TaxID=1768770 RepID=UPI0007816B4D|nr:GntR family transcriptional regulator [Caulobacter sp. CCH5-E12]
MIEKAGTGERVYLAIKTFLLAESDYRPGERVDIGDLSRRVGASASPVRAALHRMAGERLLVSHQGEGFSFPRLSEPALSDLYQWNAALLVNALRAGPARALPPAPEIAVSAPLARLEALFAVLAAQSDNVEVEWAVAGVSDRLRRVRRAEIVLVPDFGDEVAELHRLFGDGDSGAIRTTMVAYHRRRLRLVPTLVRHMHGLADREPR